MRAICVNCTLKPSPEPSNTEALADVVLGSLRDQGVDALATSPLPPPVE